MNIHGFFFIFFIFWAKKGTRLPPCPMAYLSFASTSRKRRYVVVGSLQKQKKKQKWEPNVKWHARDSWRGKAGLSWASQEINTSEFLSTIFPYGYSEKNKHYSLPKLMSSKRASLSIRELSWAKTEWPITVHRKCLFKKAFSPPFSCVKLRVLKERTPSRVIFFLVSIADLLLSWYWAPFSFNISVVISSVHLCTNLILCLTVG